MSAKENCEPLLSLYAREMIRSNGLRRFDDVSHAFARPLNKEHATRQKLAQQLERLGHPVKTVHLESQAPWATPAILPRSREHASWHVENGKIVILTSAAFADFMEKSLYEMTGEAVDRKCLTEAYVGGMETAQKAKRWLAMRDNHQTSSVAH